jgi:hypothetical protein
MVVHTREELILYFRGNDNLILVVATVEKAT